MIHTGIYQIAGCTIEITSLYKDVHILCKDYRHSGSTDFSVVTTPSDIEFERNKSVREDEIEGIPYRDFSDGYLETLAVYRKIADRMLDYDTLLFHGSAVAVDGAGYLFTAKSGTGKSTHARLWRKCLGDRAVMVNDDKPLLKVTDSGVKVCGTPWDGKHRLSSNITVPLKTVCILYRAQKNRIERISRKEAWLMLLQQAYRPQNAGKLERVMKLIDSISENALLYRLECNMENEAAVIAYREMEREEWI